MTTVLVSGIGGSIGIDVARSLRHDPSLRLVGCDSSRWGLTQTASLVDEGVMLPRADRGREAFVDALFDAIAVHRADFAFINPDVELEALAAVGRRLPCSSPLPELPSIAIALDKAKTAALTGVAKAFPRTIELADDADPERCFSALVPPLWMRSAVGAGGRGSLVVETADEARAWISYWKRRGRGYRWVFQEFLPGRNLNWTGLYLQGRLVAAAAMDRLRYFLGEATASGVSGQVALCATINPKSLEPLADLVVRGLDPTPGGFYSVDFREDRNGNPKVTEINPRLAGRPWLYTNAGVNLPLAAVRAFGSSPIGDALSSTGLADGLHLHRQLDIAPVVGTA